MTYDLLIYFGWAISSVNLVFLFALSIYYLCFWSMSGKDIVPVPHSDKKSKFAILIAARNESHVIGNIFKSLKEQTYDKDYFDVWAIVESEEDPTCQIALETASGGFDDQPDTYGVSVQQEPVILCYHDK